MPTIYLDPTSEVADAGWTQTGGSGGNIATVLDDAVRQPAAPTTAGDYATANSFSTDLRVGLANTIPTGATVTSATLWAYGRGPRLVVTAQVTRGASSDSNCGSTTFASSTPSWRSAAISFDPFGGFPSEITAGDTLIVSATIAFNEDDPSNQRLYATYIEVVYETATTVATSEATETDTAQPVTHAKRRAAGQAAETAAAQAVSAPKIRSVAATTETDTVRPATARRSVAVGQVDETDTGQHVTVSPQRRTLGQAVEADTADEIGALQGADVRMAGRASEIDSAVTIAARKTRTVTGASETSTGGAFASRKTAALARATETDTAGSIAGRQYVLVGAATEMDAARALRSPQRHPVGQAVETSIARPVAMPGTPTGFLTVLVTARAATPATVTGRAAITTTVATATPTGAAVTARPALTVDTSAEILADAVLDVSPEGL